MRLSAPRLILVGLLSVGTFIAACGGDNSTPSIPNYELDGTAPPGDASVDDETTPEVDAADAADAAPVVCPDVLPDDTTGIFVAPTGTNGATCGTRTAPCKTVAMGITRATATTKAQVNIAAGTYPEHVTLAPALELIGGWAITNPAIWKRSCLNSGQVTVLQAPATATSTVAAVDLGGEAKLTLLRIESKAAASVLPGESLYGIMATGGTTMLTLKDVTIEVASAGGGTTPLKGTDGVAVVGACAAGTGVAGAVGAVGGGAAGGSFDATGYAAAAAAAGSGGNAGNNGTAAGVVTCVSCGTCSGFADVPACTITMNAAPTCGGAGTSGCGGNPGGAGLPGTGGGSSIGVFAWDAAVSITGGSIKSGDGGNGAPGGAGGGGGAGSAGTAGVAAPACITMCGAADVAACLPNTTKVSAGATTGGAGALGGAGGVGGGGGGGASYATYQGSASLVTSTGTTLTHGKAGTGGGAGASAGTPGTAANVFP